MSKVVTTTNAITLGQVSVALHNCAVLAGEGNPAALRDLEKLESWWTDLRGRVFLPATASYEAISLVRHWSLVG
jgi:hypothetical protein